MPVATVGRRERKKIETRGALEEAAWRLFAAQGYTETTVRQITEAADVAERTFFRYYDCKEAVLFGDWRASLADLATMVRSGPAGESILEALRAAVLTVARRYEAERGKNLSRVRLRGSSPAVVDFRRRVIQPEWEDVLAAAVADRLGTGATSDLRPYLYAGAAVAAINAAIVNWLASDGVRSLTDLVAAGLDHLATSL